MQTYIYMSKSHTQDKEKKGLYVWAKTNTFALSSHHYGIRILDHASHDTSLFSFTSSDICFYYSMILFDFIIRYWFTHDTCSHPCALSLCFSHVPQGMVYEEKRVKCSRGHSFSMLSACKDWRCDECSSVFKYNPRLRCDQCDFDLCSYCSEKVRESTLPLPPLWWALWYVRIQNISMAWYVLYISVKCCQIGIACSYARD